VRARLVAVSLLVGIALPAGGALAASPQQPRTSGGIEIRLLDPSADSAHDPLGRSYIVGTMAPGTTIRRRVQITNGTGSTADIGVYAAAATLHRGRFGFGGGHRRNELASWISVSQGILRMPAGAKTLETVTIDVPSQASSGERYAVVWAEVSAPAPAAGGVTLVTRVGVRVYLSIGPGGALPANFAIGALAAKRTASGEPLVVATVLNSGQRTLDIVGELTLSGGPGGLRAGPFAVKVGAALAPDSSRVVTVPLDKRLPRGPWHAQVKLRSGFLQRGATATLTFPPQAEPTQVAPAASRHLMLFAILLGAIMAAAAALMLLLRLRRPDSLPAA
jgi:hypothetical protein